MTIRRAIVPAMLLAASVGCNSTEPDLPRENYALIYAEARSTSSGYVTLPVASFFRSLQLQVSSSVDSPDQCIDAGYSPTGGEQLTDITFLDAGAAVTAARGSETRQLTKVVNDENDTERYEVTAGGGLGFTPGDTIEFTVPGAQNGFPGFSIRARTAEAFTFDEPAVPAAGQPVQLTWTAAPAAGSSMLVSLRYQSAGSSAGLDRQIYCDLEDDGTFQIPAGIAAGWRQGTNRVSLMSRWRTQFKQVDGTSFAVVSSTFTVPTPGASPTLSRSLASPIANR